MANLYFRYATMESGKSLALMQVAYNYKQKGFKTFVVKHKVDTKGDNKLVSRIGVSLSVDLLIDEKDSFYNYLEDILNNNFCILVDEAQFLNSRQIRELFEITKIYDIPVFCYGLKTNSKGELFEGSNALFAYSDNLEDLSATICDCGRKTNFNARKINGEFTLDGPEVVIDGSDNIEYKPLCGNCFVEKVLKRTKNHKKL